jgi:outer membrane protein assembly factor BamE (lipoprotein component of BamABCDE complex)
MNHLTRLTRLTLALVLTATLAACASVGNHVLRHETPDTLQAKIIEGRTTRAEIQALFGVPMGTSFTDGAQEVWTYELTRLSADAVAYVPFLSLLGSTASGTRKSLVVMFDKDGVVRRYALHEADYSQRTGIFSR